MLANEHDIAVMKALQQGTATPEEQLHAVRLVHLLQETVATLEVQARRGRYVADHAEWYRHTEEDRGETRTWLSVRVRDDANLSCLALRQDALDEAIKKAGFR